MKLESFLTFVKGNKVESSNNRDYFNNDETIMKYITISDYVSLDGEEKYILLNDDYELAEEEDILLNLQSQKAYRGIRGIYAHNFLKVLIDYNQIIDLFEVKK